MQTYAYNICLMLWIPSNAREPKCHSFSGLGFPDVTSSVTASWLPALLSPCPPVPHWASGSWCFHCLCTVSTLHAYDVPLPLQQLTKLLQAESRAGSCQHPFIFTSCISLAKLANNTPSLHNCCWNTGLRTIWICTRLQGRHLHFGMEFLLFSQQQEQESQHG